jgi:aryl-alcohol dehydrogenase-like predicted oxidoreductase
MNPTCKMLGVSTIPWSPVSRGLLTRPVSASSSRIDDDPWMFLMKSGYEKSSDEIISRIEKVAKDKGVSMAQIAIAWVLHQDVVAAPIVGIQKISRIADTIGKFNFTRIVPYI